MLRRALDRAVAIPALLLRPEVDAPTIEPPAQATSRFVRYATWMLGITAAGLPLYVVRWKYGPISTTLLEGLVVLTIALYLAGRLQEGTLRFHRTRYELPIALLLIAGAGAVLVPPDRWHALGLYRAYFIEPIAIFYIGVDLLRRPGAVRGVLFGLGAGSSIFAVLNIAAFLVSLANGSFTLSAPPTAVYTSSPEVAMYLEPPLALAAGIFMFAERRRDRVLALGWFAVLALALALTLSRGAYLAIAVLALVAMATSRARLWIAAAVAVVVIALLQVPVVRERFAGQFVLGSTRNTLGGRLGLFSETFAMLRDHPILGVGLGGYHYLFRGKTLVIYPHDIWLTFWVELGLLGLIAFAVIFFGFIYRGWRAYPKTSGFERAVLWGVMGSWVLWGVHGLVDSPYWKNDMSVEFWILAALEIVVIGAIGRAAASTPISAVPDQPRPVDQII